MNKSSSFSNQLSDYADGPAVTAAEVRQQNFLVAAEALIPLSPMRFKRCGECGCAEHKGAQGTGHSTACSKFDLRKI